MLSLFQGKCIRGIICLKCLNLLNIAEKLLMCTLGPLLVFLGPSLNLSSLSIIENQFSNVCPPWACSPRSSYSTIKTGLIHVIS